MSKYIFTPTISGDFAEISSELSNGKIYLSNLIDSKCESLCIDLSNEISGLSDEVSAISSDLCSAISGLSDEVSAISSSLCSAISGLSDEVSAISSDLDSKIDATVTISNDLCTYTQLSVIKISKSEFDKFANKDESNALSGNVLYVVSSDYNDAYGKLLCNVAMSKNDVDSYVGIAATKPYVDEISSNINSKINSKLDTMYGAFNKSTIASNPVLKKLAMDLNDTDISVVVSCLTYLLNTLADLKN